MMQSLIRVALFFIFLSRHNDGGGWHACLEDFVARAEEPDREREPEKKRKIGESKEPGGGGGVVPSLHAIVATECFLFPPRLCGHPFARIKKSREKATICANVTLAGFFLACLLELPSRVRSQRRDRGGIPGRSPAPIARNPICGRNGAITSQNARRMTAPRQDFPQCILLLLLARLLLYLFLCLSHCVRVCLRLSEMEGQQMATSVWLVDAKLPLIPSSRSPICLDLWGTASYLREYYHAGRTTTPPG